MENDRRRRFHQQLNNFSFDSLSSNLKDIISLCFKMWDDIPLVDREHLMDSLNEYFQSQETMNKDIMMLLNYVFYSIKDLMGSVVVLAIAVAVLTVVGICTIVYLVVRIIILIVKIIIYGLYQCFRLLRFILSFFYYRRPIKDD